MPSPTTTAEAAHNRRVGTGKAAPNRSRGSLGQFVGAFFFVVLLAAVPGRSWGGSKGSTDGGEKAVVVRLDGGPKVPNPQRYCVEGPDGGVACPLKETE